MRHSVPETQVESVPIAALSGPFSRSEWARRCVWGAPGSSPADRASVGAWSLPGLIGRRSDFTGRCRFQDDGSTRRRSGPARWRARAHRPPRFAASRPSAGVASRPSLPRAPGAQPRSRSTTALQEHKLLPRLCTATRAWINVASTRKPAPGFDTSPSSSRTAGRTRPTQGTCSLTGERGYQRRCARTHGADRPR
jgi:hypothetical protein